MAELLHKIEQKQVEDKIRAKFTRIFWDIDISKLDFKKNYKLIITQVLNYGYVDEIQCIFQIYSHETIRKVLDNPIKGVWFPKTYKAFCRLLDITHRIKLLTFYIKNPVKRLINYLRYGKWGACERLRTEESAK